MKLYLYDNRDGETGGRDADAPAMFRAAAADYLAGTDHDGAMALEKFGDGILRTSPGRHGKPYFVTPPLRGRVHFSISHSGGCWAVLFHDAEAGLDVEDLRMRGRMTHKRMEGIAARFFSEGEREYLEACAEQEYQAEFFRVWTSKEAYIKYTGRGMSQGLTSFSVFDLPDGVAITTLSPLPGLVCACCGVGVVAPEVMISRYGGMGRDSLL
jgi:phosphopantetheine--protein transferase-like protein